MLSNNRGLALVAAMLAVASGGAVTAQTQGAATAGSTAMVGDAPILLGPSYMVGGTRYTPADPLSYDEVGYAGESDGGSQGGATANGEAFVAAAITAAHKTLPLPSYVEVTALDSGRTILVRVNDRGPMRNDQLIALSPGALAQLGVNGQGAIPVRVRRVNPPEQERATLRGQGRAAERLETPAALLKVLRGKLSSVHAVPTPVQPQASAKPAPVKTVPPPKAQPGADFDQAPPPPRPAPSQPAKSASPAPTTSPVRTGGYVVQVGAFSSQSRAEALAKSIGAHAAPGGGLWRVRLGPYPTQQAAQAGVRSAAAKGFQNTRIMANDAR
ncbi:RlpA-like double-psi beta-barrel domain-containing protein [Sphingobium sp. HWE2-09]|uniref:RlpA-like double-psi beta-barrel domain-containing protein n=1 Tax=Sphingobium sp. HWE2-09 TaxID=3108390 RepID=UPI002DD2D481|nr:RlpA-like double-psi beta-barrel domain-containing protein [Sphingobium sp. HWE2-09]